MNIHYKSNRGYGADSCNIVLGRLFGLCVRDEIDICTGVFNRSARHIAAVLNDIVARMEHPPKIYYMHNMPNSPEIATIIFVHHPHDTVRAIAQRRCTEEGMFRYVMLKKTNWNYEILRQVF